MLVEKHCSDLLIRVQFTISLFSSGVNPIKLTNALAYLCKITDKIFIGLVLDVKPYCRGVNFTRPLKTRGGGGGVFVLYRLRCQKIWKNCNFFSTWVEYWSSFTDAENSSTAESLNIMLAWMFWNISNLRKIPELFMFHHLPIVEQLNHSILIIMRLY